MGTLQNIQRRGELDYSKLDGALDAFLRDIEVKDSTKEGYKRSLRAFSGYLKTEGVLRPDRSGDKHGNLVDAL